MSDKPPLEPPSRAGEGAHGINPDVSHGNMANVSPPAEPLARVEAALARTGATGQEPTEDLQDAVCAYVLVCRQEGMPVEQVVITLKRHLVAHGLRGETIGRDYLVDRLVTLCIQTYFPPPRGD